LIDTNTNMADTAQIYVCGGFHHPQRNFSTSGNRRKEPEADFAKSFACTYKRKFQRVHTCSTNQETLFVREVPVSGNGIADLLVLNWRSDLISKEYSPLDIKQAGTTIRAFEFKLSNWRGGLMQAHRYKYFSHVAILVIPRKKIKTVAEHIGMFQTLGIGLWGFEPETQIITKIYTPRPKQQRITKYGIKALELVAQTTSS